MSDTPSLLAAIERALDPTRFFELLGATEPGRAFLAGHTDTITLTRSFLDSEAAIAQNGMKAAAELRARLEG